MVDTQRISRRSVIGLLVLAALLPLCVSPLAVPGAAAQPVIACSASAGAVTPSSAATAVSASSAVTPIAFPVNGGKLTVFAAASLTDAFNAMEAAIVKTNPKVQITFNFAGSPTLVTQLREGAHADVFASANNAQMAIATKAGVIAGTPITFIRNRLAIVVPKDNPKHITRPQDLATSGVTLVLAQAAVPVGQYGRESICKMGQDPATYGKDFVSKVAANVVSEENNVKAVLAKVQLGQADAGIVYTTDVTPEAAKHVTLIPIPDAVNVIATYPIAPVIGGNQTLARAFISYVLGPDGQATLQHYGFEPKS